MLQLIVHPGAKSRTSRTERRSDNGFHRSQPVPRFPKGRPDNLIRLRVRHTLSTGDDTNFVQRKRSHGHPSVFSVKFCVPGHGCLAHLYKIGSVSECPSDQSAGRNGDPEPATHCPTLIIIQMSHGYFLHEVLIAPLLAHIHSRAKDWGPQLSLTEKFVRKTLPSRNHLTPSSPPPSAPGSAHPPRRSRSCSAPGAGWRWR